MLSTSVFEPPTLHRILLALICTIGSSLLPGCQLLDQDQRSANPGDHKTPPRIVSAQSKQRAAAQLERALFDTLVTSHGATSSLEREPTPLLRLLESSVDESVLLEAQIELWQHLRFVEQEPNWLGVTGSSDQEAVFHWLAAKIQAQRDALREWTPSIRGASQHVKLNLAWDAVYAQFKDNPFGFSYSSLPDLSIKPSLLQNASPYFYQEADHSIRISQAAIDVLPAEAMAAIGIVYGLPGAHYLRSRMPTHPHFPSYAMANQQALALSLLDVMNTLRPYDDQELLMPRLAFSQSQLSKLYAGLALSAPDASEPAVRTAFAQMSQLDEPRLDLEWQDIVRNRESLARTARSYYWLWQHQLKPDTTFEWRPTDYGLAFSIWARDADRPTPFLRTFD